MHGNTFRPVGGDVVTPAREGQRQDDSSCFEDEVIVDFPSIAPAVDRIRCAFLADERPEPLQAAISLSSRDAVDGVTVPLSVQVRRTCLECGGRGESWAVSCARCTGSGLETVSQQLQVTVPPGVIDGTSVLFTLTPPHHQATRIELRIAVA